MVLSIFTVILMAAIASLLYLMVRALPRLAEEPAAEHKSFLDRWAHSEIPEKVDAAMNGFLLKFLRKVKVFVLKLDNALSHHLVKIKEEEEDKKTSIDFKDMTGQNKESESQ